MYLPAPPAAAGLGELTVDVSILWPDMARRCDGGTYLPAPPAAAGAAASALAAGSDAVLAATVDSLAEATGITGHANHHQHKAHGSQAVCVCVCVDQAKISDGQALQAVEQRDHSTNCYIAVRYHRFCDGHV